MENLRRGIISIRDCTRLTDPDKKFVFAIVPFDDDRTEIYKTIIKKTLEEEYDIYCKRADDFPTTDIKINNIIENIWKAEFIIADLTKLKPNVMYELGYAHGMGKIIIMIYEGKKGDLENQDFPFDIRHIEILSYESGTTGGAYLKDQLKIRIENVMANLTKNTQSEIKEIYIRMEDNEFKQSIISNFEIRKKRISYFTDHVVRNLIHFRNQHYQLEKLLEECVKDTNEKNIRIFTTKAESMSGFNISYSLPFTQDLLNNSSNFIANPWIVNKFLDYFPNFQLGLNEIKNVSLDSFNDFNRLITIRETIHRNIKYLDFCIEALNEERKLVYLEVIDKE
jgi:hypothetical protein